jgi:hypothetical protein
MVTPGAGIALGRSSVRTGSMGKLYQSGVWAQDSGIRQVARIRFGFVSGCPRPAPDASLQPLGSEEDDQKQDRSHNVASMKPIKLTRGTPR